MPAARRQSAIHAADVGRRVLAGLAQGRAHNNARRRAQGALTTGLVLDLAAAALAKGARRRGLAKRIAPAAGVSIRHTNRILDRLYSESD